MKDRLAYSSILLTAALFSTGGAVIKAASFTSWEIACLRSAVAALFLGIALPAAWRRMSPKSVFVGVGYAATMILYVSANKLTTAANAIFLQSTAPLYVLLLGGLLLKEPARRRDAAFIVAMIAGLTAFLLERNSEQPTAPDPTLGNLAAGVAGMTWAWTIVGLRWLARGDGAFNQAPAAILAGNVTACLVCLPIAVPLEPVGLIDWGLVAYLGVFQIGLAYLLLVRGLRKVSAFGASMILLLEPVLNPIWAFAIHGERPSFWGWIGCSIILAAMVVRTAFEGRASMSKQQSLLDQATSPPYRPDQ